MINNGLKLQNVKLKDEKNNFTHTQKYIYTYIRMCVCVVNIMII